MHVSPDISGRRLRLTVPPDQIADVVSQLRTIAELINDPVAVTRVRRMIMQLRGQDEEVTLRALPADILLVLEWGLRTARDDLDDELDRDRPAMAGAEATFDRMRWYLDALGQVERIELAAAGLSPEDVRAVAETEVEPLAVKRGRWRREAPAEQPAEPVARPA